MIATLGDVFNGKYMVVNMWKVDPNESGSLDCFACVRWYVDEEVYLDSVEEAECFVGWGCNIGLMNLQWESFWRLIPWRGNGIRKGYIWSRVRFFSLWGKKNVRQHRFIRPGRNWGVIGEQVIDQLLAIYEK